MSLQDIPQTVALASTDSEKDMTIRPADDNTDRIAATHSDAERTVVAVIVELMTVIEGLGTEVQELRIWVDALEDEGDEPEGPAGYDRALVYSFLSLLIQAAWSYILHAFLEKYI